jgi:hypothetical protein
MKTGGKRCPASPTHNRDCAEETRAKANQMENPRTKRRLRGLGDFYERLTERLGLRDEKKSK